MTVNKQLGSLWIDLTFWDSVGTVENSCEVGISSYTWTDETTAFEQVVVPIKDPIYTLPMYHRI